MQHDSIHVLAHWATCGAAFPSLNYRCAASFCLKIFMSNLCRPVEKVTESVVGNINVKWSFGLAANDTDREEVAVT